MANETKQESSKKKQHHGSRKKSYIFYDKIIYVVKTLASTNMGQKILKKTERTLNALEVTAKWGLPQGDDSKDTLERPLPWLVFLPLLLWLRIFFGVCFIAHRVVGLPLINVYASVNYIRDKRLHLKALRLQGLKSLRDRETKSTTTTTKTTTNENKPLKGLLRRIFERAICKPTQDDEVPAKPVVIKTDNGIVNSTPVFSKKLPQIADNNDAGNVDEKDDDNELTVNEMLDKYADIDSENDPDYIPEECIESDSSTSDSSQSSSPEAEIAAESTTVCNKTKKKPINGEVQENCKMVVIAETQVQNENHATDTHDTTKEQIQQPVKESEANEAVEAPREINEIPSAIAAEVATDTPKSITNYMTVPVLEENEKNSTPDHETAATSTIPKTVLLNFSPEKEKSYRTITTQTAIELDWTITIKTEISHTKHSPKLEKLNYSVNLSSASSAEDVFYSPMGSYQDIHTFYHPDPLVNDAPTEDVNSCPKDDDSYHSPSSGTPEPVPTGTKKKVFNHSSHNKHHQQNSKNYNKNRR